VKPIVVVGSYLTAVTMRVDRLPRTGETVVGSMYRRVPGGKGSNQAVAVRRLGGKASIVSCVGSDEDGDQALAMWLREGVDTSQVKRSPRHTGLGFVIVDCEGANSIAIVPGASWGLGPPDIDRAAETIARSGTMLMQLEVPPETVAAARRSAKEHGLTVILNPAPPGGGVIDLTGVDIVTPNEEEFRALTGGADFEQGARALLAKGARAVVVTLGSRGARVMTQGDSYSVPAPSVKAVDSTGCGDAFNAALAVALSEGEPLRQAVRFANYAGALCATKDEAVAAIPRRGEVDEFLRSDLLE
jgi:ribokinase